MLTVEKTFSSFYFSYNFGVFDKTFTDFVIIVKRLIFYINKQIYTLYSFHDTHVELCTCQHCYNTQLILLVLEVSIFQFVLWYFFSTIIQKFYWFLYPFKKKTIYISAFLKIKFLPLLTYVLTYNYASIDFKYFIVWLQFWTPVLNFAIL